MSSSPTGINRDDNVAATVRFRRFGWRLWVRLFGRWWGLSW